jgi:hypothetical protein
MGTVMGYVLHDRGSIPGRNFFSLLHRPDRFWGPPSYLSNGYQGSIAGVKRLGHEADHSPPSSAEVKNGGAISPISHTSS